MVDHVVRESAPGGLLRFLGCGSGFHPELGSNSAFMIEHDGSMILIDCGPSVFDRLLTLGEFREAPAVAILITRMHADHVGSLGSLIGWLHHERNLKPLLVIPKSLNGLIREFLSLQGIPESFYDVSPVAEGSYRGEFRDPLLTVRYDRVNHVTGMSSYSISLDRPEWIIYWSGDTSDTIGIKRVINTVKPEHVKMLYADASIQENPAHAGLNDIASAVPYDLRGRVTVMHLDGVKIVDRARELGFRTAMDDLVDGSL